MKHVIEVLKTALTERTAQHKRKVQLEGASPDVTRLADEKQQIADALLILDPPRRMVETSGGPVVAGSDAHRDAHEEAKAEQAPATTPEPNAGEKTKAPAPTKTKPKPKPPVKKKK
jgi:hypothetical protein